MKYLPRRWVLVLLYKLYFVPVNFHVISEMLKKAGVARITVVVAWAADMGKFLLSPKLWRTGWAEEGGLSCRGSAFGRAWAGNSSASYEGKLVPGVGLEPTHLFRSQILSLLRIPFRHPGASPGLSDESGGASTPGAGWFWV